MQAFSPLPSPNNGSSETDQIDMLRIAYQDLFCELERVLLKLGFKPDRAALCAQLFAESSRDGVYSHGLNRFPRFIKMIRNGTIDIHTSPTKVDAFGVLEQWDGNLGPGNLNAHFCMNRAIELAREHGLGCVGLRNTNHWMRGGSYGWQAADAGVIGFCWTNTMPNLPPWGARDNRIGNNPVIVGIPREEGHIVLDMAMSQFSIGTLDSYRRQQEQLPVEGGFDLEGHLTRDPEAIEQSGRMLPIGYWKGAGLSLVLDMMATLLSSGLATYQIPTDPVRECGLSQVFLTMDVSSFSTPKDRDQVVNNILDFIHQATPSGHGETVYYPGEQTLRTREENIEKGIPVDLSIWEWVRTQ